MKKDVDYLSYWNNNVEKWGKFYLQASHTGENLIAPKIVKIFYNKLITPIESWLMRKRYAVTMQFIRENVKTGSTFADIGCGIGIFTIAALKQGARVYAIDFSQQALDATRKNIEQYVPELSANVTYRLMDIQQQSIPPSDVALAMGISPYIKDLKAFYSNILPNVKLFYCLLIDSDHIFNKIRNLLPALNVRKLICYSKEEVDAIVSALHFDLATRESFASGFLDKYIPK